MLGRRRRGEAPETAAAGTTTAPDIPGQTEPEHDVVEDGPTGFALAENTGLYPSTDPAHPGYQIFFSFQGGGEVTIATPQHPAETSPVFWTVDLPPREWAPVVDPDGRLIPVELRFEDGRASARWT